MAAGDFYFAIDATFRHIHATYGKEALVQYWQAMAREYHRPLAERFRRGGLEEVRAYWAEYFAAEPGGDVEVRGGEKEVELVVRACPAIGWLRAAGRDIVPCYCEHCRHVSGTLAAAAGMTFALTGGDGACRQVFRLQGDTA